MSIIKREFNPVFILTHSYMSLLKILYLQLHIFIYYKDR